MNSRLPDWWTDEALDLSVLDKGEDTGPDARDTGHGTAGTPDARDTGHGTAGTPDARDTGHGTAGTPDARDTGQDTDTNPDDTTSHGRAWTWHWLTPHVHPWKTLIAVVLVLVPMPWTGYSAATTWAYTVQETRDTSLYAAYGIAFGAFALAVAADRRRPRLITRIAGAITFIGIFGALHWYDPVTILTGVTL